MELCSNKVNFLYSQLTITTQINIQNYFSHCIKYESIRIFTDPYSPVLAYLITRQICAKNMQVYLRINIPKFCD